MAPWEIYFSHWSSFLVTIMQTAWHSILGKIFNMTIIAPSKLQVDFYVIIYSTDLTNLVRQPFYFMVESWARTDPFSTKLTIQNALGWVTSSQLNNFRLYIYHYCENYQKKSSRALPKNCFFKTLRHSLLVSFARFFRMRHEGIISTSHLSAPRMMNL